MKTIDKFKFWFPAAYQSTVVSEIAFLFHIYILYSTWIFCIFHATLSVCINIKADIKYR